jgi:hypothetical protein
MFEAGKEYQTRDGRRARVYATDGRCDEIHGAILFPEGWASWTWFARGNYLAGGPHAHDLRPSVVVSDVVAEVARAAWMGLRSGDDYWREIARLTITAYLAEQEPR